MNLTLFVHAYTHQLKTNKCVQHFLLGEGQGMTAADGAKTSPATCATNTCAKRQEGAK